MCLHADMHREIGELLLGDDLAEYSSNDEGLTDFKRGMGIAARLLHGIEPEGYCVEALNDLLASQWTDPILNKIMNGDELETDIGSSV